MRILFLVLASVSLWCLMGVLPHEELVRDRWPDRLRPDPRTAAGRLAAASSLEMDARTLDASQRVPALERAIGLVESIVSSSPADAYAWAHLARLHFLRDGATPSAGRALLMSIAAAPVESHLQAWRAQMSLLVRAALASDDLDRVRRHNGVLERLEPGRFAEIAADLGLSYAVPDMVGPP